MNIQDAIDLLGPNLLGNDLPGVTPDMRAADATRPQTWADLGCGEGTFTRALAAHLPEGSTIHAVDRDRAALRHLPAEDRGVRIQTHAGDFTEQPWRFADRHGILTGLDGILMANALHYVPDQPAFIERCAATLTSTGSFVIVEYDTDSANPWVPYPLSRTRLASLFDRAGYPNVEPLGSRPSLYGRARLYAVRIAR